MIPISKQIINNKQKRAAQRVARFLRVIEFMVSICFLWAS